MVYADDLAGELELTHERVVLGASHDEGHGRHAGHRTPQRTLHNIHKLAVTFATEILTLLRLSFPVGFRLKNKGWWVFGREGV